MSGPQTAAGRQLADGFEKYYFIAPAILRIEAEAVAARDRELRAAASGLPPGPYHVEWPEEQGGLFTLWGKQGTPPDFTDGWAIPLVASGTDTAINALAEILRLLADPEP